MSVDFAARLRGRERLVGYWSQLPVPSVQERVARHGYDYVCLDPQHGLMDQTAILNGLLAIDAGAALAPRPCAGVVRLAANDMALIGQALDHGARAVIVPLVDSAADAARAVAACRYPPQGRRSFGPVRSALRIGGDTAAVNAGVACIAMIETAAGLAAVDEIAAVEGIDGLYIGPADLRLGLGARMPFDSALDQEFAAALARVRQAAERAGIAVGIHTFDGAAARRWLDQGFTFTSVSSDLGHLDLAAGEHLRIALAG